MMWFIISIYIRKMLDTIGTGNGQLTINKYINFWQCANLINSIHCNLQSPRRSSRVHLKGDHSLYFDDETCAELIIIIIFLGFYSCLNTVFNLYIPFRSLMLFCGWSH